LSPSVDEFVRACQFNQRNRFCIQTESILHSQGESSLTGDLLALFSAVGFGLTSVLIKWYSPSDDAVNYPMFFGFLG
jgi:drug/metabolite transporter (DMT)-like permease